MVGRHYIKNWFSNFNRFETPIMYQWINYFTVENFYQAMKTLDIEERRKVSGMTPGNAKRYCGPRNGSFKFREDWENIKVSVMRFALLRKFVKGTCDYDRLLGTGDEEIVEWNNWHDNIWGSCVCSRCTNKYHQNLLGQLLMNLRHDLRVGNVLDESCNFG